MTKLDATIFVFMNKATGRVITAYREEAEALQKDESLLHAETVDPRSWIEHQMNIALDARDGFAAKAKAASKAKAINYKECPDDCMRCSGEYCGVHRDKPCECDVIERHCETNEQH